MIIILQFLIGKSGSGKSCFMKEKLKSLIKNGNKNIIYFVPEQNSFETERDLLNFLGEKDFRFVTVLTFERISDFIFRKVGAVFKDNLTDGERHVFMSLSIEKANNDNMLSLYKKSSNDPDMIEVMVKTFKETKSHMISCEDLDKCKNILQEGVLKQKISEISEILKNYDLFIKNKATDPMDNLTFLLDILKDTKLLCGYTLFVDSFVNLNTQRIKFLAEMIKQAKDSFVSFCLCNKNEEKTDIFLPVEKMINKITHFLKDTDIKIEKPVLFPNLFRFVHEDLKFLNENIFLRSKKIYENEPKNISVYNACDIYDECEFVARTIRKSVIENSMRYRDFAVITRNVSLYNEKIESIFSKYDIPYFMDTAQKVEDKLIFVAIFSLLDIIISNFETSYVFRYLKTGLSGLGTEEISMLENYVFMWDIKSDSWKKPFDANPRGFCVSMSEDDKKVLNNIEKIRKSVISPILEFKKETVGKTGDEISKSFYKFLEKINIRKNIRNFCSELIDDKKLTYADQQSRLWDIFVNSLNSISKALCGISVSLKRYKELLRLVVNCQDISFIPEGLDEVTVSSAEKRFLSERKVVFLIGASDGEFPMMPMPNAIFNESEIQKISSVGFEMLDDFQTLISFERLFAYIAISCASEKVYVSWPSFGLSKEEPKLGSEIVKEIKEIFPKIKILDKFSFKQSDLLWCEKEAFNMLSQNFNSENSFYKSLKKYFFENENYKEKTQSILNSSNPKYFLSLSEKDAKEIYGDNIKISASAVEKFYSCKFNYFCCYGLNIKERKQAKFANPEFGNLVHFVLEKIFSTNDIDFILGANFETLNRLMDDIMNKYVNIYLGGWENKNLRFKYLFLRSKKVLLYLINLLIEEFKQSSFKPLGYEIKISQDSDVPSLVFDLPGKGTVTMEGKIDRVDVMELNNKKYIRVVDYKTGKKDFNISYVIYGLDMQIIFYLSAFLKSKKDKSSDFIPAGALYMSAYFKDKEEKAKNKNAMNGFILDDEKIISGMEKNQNGVFIPAYSKNNKTFLTSEQINTVMKYAEKMAKDMAKSVWDGEICASPIKLSSRPIYCSWCGYKPICRFFDENSCEKASCGKKDEIDIFKEMERKMESNQKKDNTGGENYE